MFPGPIMPQLPFDRNMMVLLGSYMAGLAFNFTRLAPLLQRCGDLLQRESLLTNPRDRQLTSEMTNSIGRALEEVSRATGSVAHFYRTLHIQEQPGQCRLDTRAFNPEFRPIIEQVGSIVAGPSGVQTS
jgi:hypothetical protein